MEIGTVIPVNIEDEIQNSYLDYAMSVIVSRALPDVRDGLKPVQRRILYAMDGLGLRPTGPFKKSARIVGEVLGKYHPHGDAPVYEAMVRMAQDFSMRYALVDGQGNFGSEDNDPPAAMRYTEARLTPIAEEMLFDIDKDTVDFVPNFDDTISEPTILPSRLPNLLLNGASGIAVGMATNIPPHNLSELCEGIIYLIDNPDATIDELISLIPGPDFPTGGLILGRQGIKSAYATGQGKLIIRAKTDVEQMAKGRYRIVITELPFQTNKAALVERIATLVRNKKLDGIAEVRDESGREGVRVVIELKKEGQPKLVLNNLYKHTPLQSAFFVNILALVDAQPRVINLKTALQCYIDFRRQVISRRSEFELKKTKERVHLLEGFNLALEHLSEVIDIIKNSETVELARDNLMVHFGFSSTQARAILEMQLRRLAALEQRKVAEEYAEALKTISYLEDLLSNPKKLDFLIKEEVNELESRYGDGRHTQISDEEVDEFSAEDLIPHQMVVVTLSRRGYIKRLPIDSYRLQHRGGRGVRGSGSREDDTVQHMVVADTHARLLLFTNRGRVFSIRCYQIHQESSRQAKGMPIINVFPIDAEEQVTAIMSIADSAEKGFVVMDTRFGEIKRTELGRFASIRSSGLLAMAFKEGDELVSAKVAKEEDDVILITQGGKAIRFAVSSLRIASRTSGGVRGIHLEPGDRVVGMDIVSPNCFLFTITANGFGKRTPLTNYRPQKRGGNGVKAYRLSSKTGPIVAAAVIQPSQELSIVSQEGFIIRMAIEDIPSSSRATRGVHLVRLSPGDSVASVTTL
jgi:DNA gyrase subunit A